MEFVRFTVEAELVPEEPRNLQVNIVLTKLNPSLEDPSEVVVFNHLNISVNNVGGMVFIEELETGRGLPDGFRWVGDGIMVGNLTLGLNDEQLYNQVYNVIVTVRTSFLVGSTWQTIYVQNDLLVGRYDYALQLRWGVLTAVLTLTPMVLVLARKKTLKLTRQEVDQSWFGLLTSFTIERFTRFGEQLSRREVVVLLVGQTLLAASLSHHKFNRLGQALGDTSFLWTLTTVFDNLLLYFIVLLMFGVAKVGLLLLAAYLLTDEVQAPDFVGVLGAFIPLQVLLILGSEILNLQQNLPLSLIYLILLVAITALMLASMQMSDGFGLELRRCFVIALVSFLSLSSIVFVIFNVLFPHASIHFWLVY